MLVGLRNAIQVYLMLAEAQHVKKKKNRFGKDYEFSPTFTENESLKILFFIKSETRDLKKVNVASRGSNT